MGKRSVPAEQVSIGKFTTDAVTARSEAVAMHPNLFVTLSDPLAQKIFKEIVENRSMSFRDIRKSLATTTDGMSFGSSDQPTDPLLKSAVDVLKKADLIKESRAPIDDFTNYYVTSYGLNVARELSRFSAA